MKKIIFILAFFTVLSIACNTNPTSSSGNSDSSVSNLSVETRKKVAPNQKPVFKEQTRVAGAKTQTKIVVTTLATGLHHPWGLEFLPDGKMIVSERPGTIRIITPSGKVGNPLANVPPVRSTGDGGLLDIKLDPDFASTRLVFWSYVKDSAGTGRNVVARARLSKDETSLENVTVIYRGTSPYAGPNHNGSRMLFDRAGLLYVTFGERFDDSIRIQAQQLNSSLGKIIRINKNGTAAAGNPFVNVAGDLPEIFSYGHRNPQGLAFNPVTGDLWESEHGPQAGDEVNIIKPGRNYGWPIIAYGLEYSGKPVNGTGLTQKDGMEQPVYYWDPSIAPSGITFYTGSLIPEWRNNLFIAALGGMHIVRLIIKDNKVIGEERLLEDQHKRFRDVVQGPDGALYAITDEDDGRIYRIGI
jgi:glucose/arabinose dehydrogenase